MTADPTSVPDRVAAPHPRRAAWAGPAALVVAVVLWNVGASAIDASGLGRARGPWDWGFSFSTAIYSVIVGLPVLLLALVTAVVGTFVPSTFRGALGVGAGLSALTGAVLGVTGLVVLASAAGDGGDVVFAVLTLVVAVVLWAPAWWAWDVLVGDGPRERRAP